MSNSIFDIAKYYADLEQMLYESGGEITPELEQALVISRQELESKGQGYHHLIQKNKLEIAMIKQEKARLERFENMRENAIKTLKERLEIAMKVYDIPKISFATGSITLVKTTNPAEVVDESLIPEKFKTIKVTIRKTDINKAVKEGEAVPGTEKRTKTHLLIK